MARKVLIYSVIVIAAVIAAGAIYARLDRESEGDRDFPEGHPYICLDCGQVTVLTHAQLMDFKAQAREQMDPDARNVPCAECDSRNTTLAVRCPRCGAYFARPGPGLA